MNLPKFLSDVVANILDDNHTHRHHLETLRGPRTRGSSTAHGLEVLADRELDRTDHPAIGPGCVGYRIELTPAEVELLRPVVGAKPLDQLAPHARVQCRYGAHGWELFCDDYYPEDLPTVNEVYVIWSTDAGCVATWHPGPPMTFLPKACAVKVA